VHIEPLGESMLLLRFGMRIDPLLNAQVHAAIRALAAARLPGVHDLVPAYAALAIAFDPLAWLDCAGEEVDMRQPWQRLAARVEAILATMTLPTRAESPTIEIAVCYGGEYGEDLDAVAAHANLETGEIIARHTAPNYRVAMLGFAPGFAYLLGLDKALYVPRRAQPRVRVPAGSVAIGGAQTGIYPRELPGGWQLIGRTPMVLFDAVRANPALLAAGTQVRFVAIDPDQFAALTTAQARAR